MATDKTKHKTGISLFIAPKLKFTERILDSEHLYQSLRIEEEN